MNKHRHGHHAGGGFRRIRRTVSLVALFLGFFVLSNYYLGFFNSDPIVSKPVIPKAVDGGARKPPITIGTKVDNRGGKTGKDRGNNNGIKNGNNGNSNGNNDIEEHQGHQNHGGGKQTSVLSFNPPPVEEDNWPEPAQCIHTRDRDYDKNPIAISGRFGGRAECDVPCVGDGRADASVGSRSGSCSHVKSIFFTMENSIPPRGSYDIVANTQLTSDVPLPYFSWAEYDFKQPVRKKTAGAHVAAFISNCGPQRRLHWMEVMQKHGVKIDSYGSCMHNKEIPGEYSAKYGANYNGIKADIVAGYKFVMAFENSGTDDYVTEKLFGVLVAGAVPLYDGAPNGKKFGPSAKSMIFAEDYGTPEKLAEYLLYLDKNDTAYEEYLQWKKTGPSDEWVALVDLAKVHSNCRLCIRAADLNRKEVGPVIKGQPVGEKKPSGKYLELQVRERGKFWLRSIYLTEFSIEQLKEKINTYVPHDTGSYLFSIYDLWTRQPIATDEDVSKLGQKTELEAIFVVPEKWESLKLMW